MSDTAVINGITYYKDASDKGNCYIENQCTCTGQNCDCSGGKCVYKESFAGFDPMSNYEEARQYVELVKTQSCDNESSSFLILVAIVIAIVAWIYHKSFNKTYMYIMLIIAAVFFIVGVNGMCEY